MTLFFRLKELIVMEELRSVLKKLFKAIRLPVDFLRGLEEQLLILTEIAASGRIMGRMKLLK